MNRVRMAQYSTKHGHASGKLQALRSNPGVEVAGVYEPDPQRRRALEQQEGPFRGVRFFDRAEELLGDPSIVAVASEGLNAESLDQTEQLVAAGKHVWYDKPAGDHWAQWQRVMASAAAQGLLVQMGYMFRYHDGFQRLGQWVRSGLLGAVFAVRAHMSTNIPEAARRVISNHAGGIFYDLGGHMLDQVVWMLGRPERVTAFLRNDSGSVPGFSDNTLAVCEYARAMAWVDIAAMEARPMARRFEVYGSHGSAVLLEPFEPGQHIRLCLEKEREGYRSGEQLLPIEPRSRQRLYELELEAFLGSIAGRRPADRPPAHELLVQETLLRATGKLPV
jgi:predicted dehydrogenase